MANNDFFLSPDDAQTLGDINYMRKSVRVRHTFPKNLKNPNGFEIVKEVSSSEDQVVGNFNDDRSENSSSQWITNNNNNDFSSQTVPSSTKPRNPGTSINMFRDMARNIRK